MRNSPCRAQKRLPKLETATQFVKGKEKINKIPSFWAGVSPVLHRKYRLRKSVFLSCSSRIIYLIKVSVSFQKTQCLSSRFLWICLGIWVGRGTRLIYFYWRLCCYWSDLLPSWYFLKLTKGDIWSQKIKLSSLRLQQVYDISMDRDADSPLFTSIASPIYVFIVW